MLCVFELCVCVYRRLLIDLNYGIFFAMNTSLDYRLRYAPPDSDPRRACAKKYPERHEKFRVGVQVQVQGVQVKTPDLIIVS